jgi:hypothetical protein
MPTRVDGRPAPNLLCKGNTACSKLLKYTISLRTVCNQGNKNFKSMRNVTLHTHLTILILFIPCILTKSFIHDTKKGTYDTQIYSLTLLWHHLHNLQGALCQNLNLLKYNRLQK